MALIQVALEVPDDVYVALLNGDLIRRGGVVRDATGQIVVHLKEVAWSTRKLAKPRQEKPPRWQSRTRRC